MIIPITLITGFLGSGKTSFVNKILKERSDLKISVILNEFGNVPIESEFVKSHDGDVIELKNGCMCCVASGDFIRIIKWIVESKPDTEYILIEASGLSDPLPVAEALSGGELSDKLRLDSIVCVIDALNFFNIKDKYNTVMLQVANSDVAVVSKWGESGAESMDKIKMYIHKLFPRILVGQWGDASLYELILDTDRKHQFVPDPNHKHEHETVVELYWQSEKPLDFNKFNNFLKQLPAGVIRVKGLLWIKEKEMDKKFLLQYVSTRSEVIEKLWKDDESKQNAVVFIGRDFDRDELKNKVESCFLIEES